MNGLLNKKQKFAKKSEMQKLNAKRFDVEWSK